MIDSSLYFFDITLPIHVVAILDPWISILPVNLVWRLIVWVVSLVYAVRTHRAPRIGEL